MRPDRCRRASDFLTDAGAWLAEREAEHKLLQGFAGGLGDKESIAGGEPLVFALVRRAVPPGGRCRAQAPWNLPSRRSTSRPRSTCWPTRRMPCGRFAIGHERVTDALMVRFTAG